jgi:hypothetical protein
MVRKFSRRVANPVMMIVALVYAACTAAPSLQSAQIPTPITTTLATSTPLSDSTRTPASTTAPSDDEIASRVSAVNPVTIYSGPGSDHPEVAILDAGANARVIETRDGGWMKITCPDNIAGSCWVSWDINALHFYEGPPITLTIPDPASLTTESASTTTSPDGRWETLVTQFEGVPLDGEAAFYYYAEFTVTSLEDGRTWTPVSKWYFVGLGQEYAPQPFHWSQDGRYLYFTSFFDLGGACVSMNIGETLNRLDLSDGSVAALQPPHAFRLLTISPDESKIAHLGGQSIINYTNHKNLVVREMATAYTEGIAGQESVLWEIPLDIDWPTAVTDLTWSPDGRKILVTTTTLADVGLCTKASATTWELDVKTGKLVEVSSTVFSTPAP